MFLFETAWIDLLDCCVIQKHALQLDSASAEMQSSARISNVSSVVSDVLCILFSLFAG